MIYGYIFEQVTQIIYYFVQVGAMKGKKTKKAKFRVKTNLEGIDDGSDRKSYVAKKQLEMISLDQEEFSIINYVNETESEYKQCDEGIRTTANTIEEEKSYQIQERKIPYKRNVQSRYLQEGYWRGQKYSLTKNQKKDPNKMFVSNLKFDSMRVKTKNQLQTKIQEAIREKRRRFAYSKKTISHQYLSQRCFQSQIPLIDDSLPLSQRDSRHYYTFNDAIQTGKGKKKSRMMTLPDKEKLSTREQLLRPEMFRLIAKIRKNEEKKEKLSESQLSRRNKFK